MHSATHYASPSTLVGPLGSAVAWEEANMVEPNGERLARDGGPPVRTTPLPGVERRAMGDEEIAALTDVIRSGQLGRHGGTKVKELERAFAELYGVKHAVAVTS